jgi:hypothetical protein
MTNSSSSGRMFACINYPGLVKNDEEAIRTLGGIERISAALSKRNGKLLLNFSPSNIFSKTLCSSSEGTIGSELSQTTVSSSQPQQQQLNSQSQSQAEMQISSQLEQSPMPSLVLSVRSKSDKKITKAEVIGRVQKFLSFESIADFQYLPMMSRNIHHHHHSSSQFSRPSTSTNSYTYTPFHHSFDFSSIGNYENDLRRSLIPPQLFILPTFFSRFNDAVNYSFRSEPTKRSELLKPQQSTKDINGSKSLSEKNEQKAITDKANSSKGALSSVTENSIDEQEPGSSPKRAVKDKLHEDAGSVLIKSLRQERSSQAVLVTYNCEKIPMGHLFLYIRS